MTPRTTSRSHSSQGPSHQFQRQAWRLGPLLLAVLLPSTLSAQQPPDPGTYEGRDIAHVMSYHGATWLERESRVNEEDPAAMLAALPIEAGDVTVDLGCGSGYYARRMARAVGPHGRVLCVDIQPEMLEIAKTLAEREGLDNIETRLNTPTDTKLEPGSVDLILLVDVYHEFSHPAEMLASMRAALKPGGVVALVEFRLEGETARFIKRDHRMSVEQVKKEWLPAGFELVELVESLPSQHLFLFSRDTTADN